VGSSRLFCEEWKCWGTHIESEEELDGAKVVEEEGIVRDGDVDDDGRGDEEEDSS
jgi:hypothetical protein